MLKVWLLISDFTLLKYLIFWLNQFHINHKSHVYQPTIIIYQYVENFEFFLCMLLFKSAWFTLKFIYVSSFHSTTLFNCVLNNILFMFLTWVLNYNKVFDLHIMITNCPKCYKFQCFASYENNMFWSFFCYSVTNDYPKNDLAINGNLFLKLVF
jgi:hypothetical protein